jgi:uroporphyrinogen III methyltransferase/synthase
MEGKVYLVGAGPGDPELLTLKGRRVLERSDVVVYDRLANPRLLELAREAAERIYVGKEASRHAMTQEEINHLLVERARAGRTVCRLKGGDPFLFGRGGEEAEALEGAGVEWEYVPGVTSAIAAPGYAGIPVTHRGLCSTLAIVTAHEDPARGESAIRWDHLATAADTLVFMMGVERLPVIVEELLAHGKPPETPAAVVSWGSYARQQTVEGTLGDILERARLANVPAPAVTVVGEVAALRERLRWWDRRPLFGRRIVVTRPREQAWDLVGLLEAAGAEAVLCPTIRIESIENPDLSGLAKGYDWVVFTSINGVYSVAAALKASGRDVRALGSARIAAIGPETARAVEGLSLRVEFVPSRYVAEQIIEEFPEPLAGKRVLIPRAREAREVLPNLWRRQGARVDVVPVYETVTDGAGASALKEQIAAKTIDALTFTASSTVRSLAAFLPPEILNSVTIACIGPITAATARELGLRVDVTAETYTVRGLVEALERYYAAAEPSGSEV